MAHRTTRTRLLTRAIRARCWAQSRRRSPQCIEAQRASSGFCLSMIAYLEPAWGPITSTIAALPHAPRACSCWSKFGSSSQRRTQQHSNGTKRQQPWTLEQRSMIQMRLAFLRTNTRTHVLPSVRLACSLCFTDIFPAPFRPQRKPCNLARPTLSSSRTSS
ncbi:hypothetical protein BCR34DRAFT_556564 [Clohesyomyces aquaticus]|uniref:Uncharacterized protein n=1 Tax=Clohesyomyces aquaticus TaxID=1231657 RepID=A0A1Y2A414_9PLEO|nr:hypothetical protein BCR34DRAFT_556564 [Clohesyomyces aquaticus]